MADRHKSRSSSEVRLLGGRFCVVDEVVGGDFDKAETPDVGDVIQVKLSTLADGRRDERVDEDEGSMLPRLEDDSESVPLPGVTT